MTHAIISLDATHALDRPAAAGYGGMSADEMARATAVNLHGEFGTVLTTDEALARLTTE